MAAFLLLGLVSSVSPARPHDGLGKSGVVDPLFIPPEESKVGFYTSKTQVRFTQEQKQRLLQLHNEYRSAVMPPAANMRYMEWNEYLAISAQKWIENCIFEHGFDPEYHNRPMGQNLYYGGDPSGERGLFLWFNETFNYDFRKDYCLPGTMCGHYTQMVWADSHEVGCAVNYCPQLGYYVSCHYSPPGNVQGQRAYLIGKECSQCHDDDNGGLCYKGQCVTKDQCTKYNLKECECNLECYNCGRLMKDKCRCQCCKGWDSLDCSKKCEDRHHYCNKSPGFLKSTCSHKDYLKIPKEFCRAMCNKCDMIPENQTILHFFHPNSTGENGLNPICCGGMQCPYGYVLITRICDCQPLCPGPICDGAVSSRILETSTFYLFIFYLIFTQWSNH